MWNFLARYRHITLFVVFVLISITLLSFNRPFDKSFRPSNVMERTVLLILEPFQNTVSSLITHFQHAWHRYIALVHLSEENQQLRAEVKKLRAERNLYIEQLLAYERLKGTLQLVEERHFSTILARVIGYDSTNQSHTIIVNRGADDGVQESWPVITHDGVVGVTISVSKKSSKVLLLIDPNCNVAALIQRTRDQGIVGGQAKKDAYAMKYVNRSAEIQAGAFYRITEQAFSEMAKEDIPGFELTDETFSQLEVNGVPADILIILEDLRGQRYPNQEKFITALEKTLGKEQADWYTPLILRYSMQDVLAQLYTLKNRQHPTKAAFIQTLETTLGKERTQAYEALITPYAQEEEVVVSSGLGGIFPKGLRVGTVSRVVKQDYGLFQEVEIAPGVDFSKLEEVLIIRRDRSDVPR